MKIIIYCFLFCSFCSQVIGQPIFKALKEKNYSEVENLLAKGEDVNQYGEKGDILLQEAVWNKDLQMVKLLLNKGAKVDLFDKNGKNNLNSLHVASQNGLLEIVQTLVEAGADVNSKGIAGFEPIRIASRNGWLEIVKYLEKKGGVVDAKADDGATALSHSCAKGHVEIVKFLLGKGANPNNQDTDLDTPLTECAKIGNIKIATLLLERGAKLDYKNKEGKTAIEVAKLAGQNQLAQYLESKQAP